MSVLDYPVLQDDAVLYAWNPSDGPLSISFLDGQQIGSIWLPKIVDDITFVFSPAPESGVASYVAFAPQPENVVVPTGVLSASLSAITNELLYVYATATVFPPYKGGIDVRPPQEGTISGVDGTGVALSDLLFPTPYASNVSVILTPQKPLNDPSTLIASIIEETKTLQGCQISLQGGIGLYDVDWIAVGK